MAENPLISLKYALFRVPSGPSRTPWQPCIPTGELSIPTSPPAATRLFPGAAPCSAFTPASRQLPAASSNSTPAGLRKAHAWCHVTVQQVAAETECCSITCEWPHALPVRTLSAAVASPGFTRPAHAACCESDAQHLHHPLMVGCLRGYTRCITPRRKRHTTSM